MLFVENISHLSIYCLDLLLVSCSLKVVETWICIANDLLRLLLLCSSGSVLAGTRFYLELGAQLVVFDLDLLGEVLVEGSSGWGRGQDDLVEKGRQQAGQMGANAILVLPAEEVSGASRVTAALFGTNDNSRRVRALRLEPEKATPE